MRVELEGMAQKAKTEFLKAVAPVDVPPNIRATLQGFMRGLRSDITLAETQDERLIMVVHRDNDSVTFIVQRGKKRPLKSLAAFQEDINRFNDLSNAVQFYNDLPEEP